MTIESAREELGQSYVTILGSELETLGISVPLEDFNSTVDKLLEPADRYALTAHVETCGIVLDSCHICCPYGEECTCDEFCECEHGAEKASLSTEELANPIRCGTDGRYCKKAEAIQQLGKAGE